MAFDFFTQPTGPQVPISLFGEAATAGTNVGKATPTPLTAAIQGGIQGVKTGLEIARSAQQLDIGAEQLEKDKLQNEILQLDTKVATDNEDLYMRAKKAELEAAANKSEQAVTDYKVMDEITAALTSNDPAAKKGIINNPNFKGTLLRNPKLAEGVVGSLVQQGLLNADEQQGAFAALDFAKTMENKQKILEIDETAKKTLNANYDKIQENLSKGNIPALMAEFGLQDSDLGKIRFAQKGLYEVDPKTKTINTSKEPANLAADELTYPNQFIAIVPDASGAEKVSTLVYSAADRNNIALMQNALKARGIMPAAPVATPVPKTPTSTPQGKPFLSRLFGDQIRTPEPTNFHGPQASVISNGQRVESGSSNAVVNQSARDLSKKADSDPDLMNRLIKEGLIKEAQGTPPTPQVIPVPKATSPTQASTTTTKEISPVTPAPQTAVTLKKNISYTYKVLSPSAKKYANQEVIYSVLKEPLLKNLDPLYKAVAAVESGGRREAKNKKSTATGLFQLTADAATDVKVNRNIPFQNAQGGVKYLDQMIDRFEGNEIAALLAYRVGAGTVQAAINLVSSSNYEDLVYALYSLKAQGKFKKELADLSNAVTYPLQVQAYKEAFQAVRYA